MRDVSAETGLSPSTLTRLGQGQKPDADGLVTLLAWLKAEAAEFAVPRDSRPVEIARATASAALGIEPWAQETGRMPE